MSGKYQIVYLHLYWKVDSITFRLPRVLQWQGYEMHLVCSVWHQCIPLPIKLMYKLCVEMFIFLVTWYIHLDVSTVCWWCYQLHSCIMNRTDDSGEMLKWAGQWEKWGCLWDPSLGVCCMVLWNFTVANWGLKYLEDCCHLVYSNLED